MQRKIVQILLALSILTGVLIAADALVLTDEERLESFVDALSGEIDERRIDGAMSWIDPNRERVELVTGRDVYVFDEGHEAELSELARATLLPLSGSEIDLVQRSIEIEGEDARIGVRVRTRSGLVDARFDMRKHGDRWLVRRVRVS